MKNRQDIDPETLELLVSQASKTTHLPKWLVRWFLMKALRPTDKMIFKIEIRKEW